MTTNKPRKPADAPRCTYCGMRGTKGLGSLIYVAFAGLRHQHCKNA